MTCPKCGREVPDGVRYCGKCGRKIKQSVVGKYLPWGTGLLLLVVLLVVGCVFVFRSDSNDESRIAADIHDREIRDVFKNDYSIFLEGSATDINALIFGVSNEAPKDDIHDILSQYGIDVPEASTKTTPEYGVFNTILDRVVITANRVEQVDDGYIVAYTVIAPDLTHILANAEAFDESWTPDDFANYVLNYIEDAEITNNEVVVTYKKVDGVVSADYQTPEFINAVTGGLLNAYSQAFIDIFNSLQEVH